MNIFKSLFLSTPEISAEQIHAEVDAAEEKSMKSLNDMLINLGVIPTDHIRDKAERMKRLGFVKNEVVEIAKNLNDKEENVNKRLKQFQIYKNKYPTEKIISFDEFQKIMDKYKLVFAPVKEYIKDIPEKVLINIEQAKPVLREHISDKRRIKITWIDLDSGSNHRYESLIKKICSNNTFDIDRILSTYNDRDIDTIFDIIMTDHCPGISGLNIRANFLSFKVINEFDDLQIAAPISHFDKSYFENIKKETIVTKDPIAFFLLKEGFVRIIDKWGTDDDQSYLDPALTNEINN